MKAITGWLLLLLLAGCATRGVPATDGILNFGRVNDVLYRGAQPGLDGVAELKAMGVKSVIDLRRGGEVDELEPAAAAALGLTYTNIPLRGMSAPSDAQVASVLSAILDLPGPVFVHCKHGCDRTGTVIACYRIRHDRWATSKAMDEAEFYGISSWEFGMRSYVKRFGERPGDRP